MPTTRLIDHIERLREKPEPVRHTIALGVAFGVSSVVALGWITAMATSGALALSTPEPSESRTETPKTLADSMPSFSSLVGAADAAFSATNTDASLTIVESRTSSTMDASAPQAGAGTGKTVIPF